jgi:hypothetical protein
MDHADTHAPIRRLSLSRLAAEFVTVALGVLVGLAADQWKETRAHRQLAATALAGVRDEIAANAVEVEQRRAYHQRLRDSANAVMNRTVTRGPAGLVMRPGARLPTPPEMGFTNGFGTVMTLGSTAWQTILSTNVLSYLDYGTIHALTEAYEAQQHLRQQLRDLGGQLPLAVEAYFIGQNQVRAQLLSTLTLTDVIAAEGDVLCAYDRLFARIGGAPSGWRAHDCPTAPRAARDSRGPGDAHDSRDAGGGSRRP